MRLRYVLICFTEVVQSLHILLLYQCLYGPLDHVHIGDELGLHLTDCLQCKDSERAREKKLVTVMLIARVVLHYDLWLIHTKIFNKISVLD